MSKVTPKPWGHEEILLQTPEYVVKHIYVKANSSLSLQYHKEKTETMFLIAGVGFVEIQTKGKDPQGGVVKANYFKRLKKLAPLYIPPGVVHRLYTEDADCVVLEISSTELEDVVRLEDRYGRA